MQKDLFCTPIVSLLQCKKDGRVSGIRPEVDINVFNGYRSEYEDFLQRECIK